MPSVYDFKPRFQRFLRPLIGKMARLGVTPNLVTLTALAGSCAVGIMVAALAGERLWLLLLPAWLFVRMALNAIDGMMARELAMSSDVGAMLNELGDALSDLTIYLSLAFVTPAAQWPAIAFAIGAVMTEFCGLLGRALGASRRYDGPMGKSDRALLVGALGLFTALIPSLVPAWPRILWLGTVLTGITCLHRLARALKEIPSR